MEFRQGPLLVDKFSLLMELLEVMRNTSVEDSMWLEELLVDRDSRLPVEKSDRGLLVESNSLLLEDYNNQCSV